jgi:hypothetical protein
LEFVHRPTTAPYNNGIVVIKRESSETQQIIHSRSIFLFLFLIVQTFKIEKQPNDCGAKQSVHNVECGIGILALQSESHPHACPETDYHADKRDNHHRLTQVSHI